MIKIVTEIQVNVPKEQVWSMIANLGGISKFHPFVNKSYYTTDQKEGVEAARICELSNGVTVEETVIEWVEGQRIVLGVETLQGPKPPFISNFAGAMLVRDDGKGGTIVGMEIDWQENAGPLGWVVGNFIMKPQLGKIVPSVLQGLKHYAETGELVNGNVAKQVRTLAAEMS